MYPENQYKEFIEKKLKELNLFNYKKICLQSGSSSTYG